MNRKKIISIAISVVFMILCMMPVVQAANLSKAFDYQNTAASGMGYQTASTLTPEYLVSRIIFYALYFLGVIFIILTIYGGFLWMTSRGNEKNTEKAREVLTASVIGLIIIIAAYAVTWMIVNAFTGYLS